MGKLICVSRVKRLNQSYEGIPLTVVDSVDIVKEYSTVDGVLSQTSKAVTRQPKNNFKKFRFDDFSLMSLIATGAISNLSVAPILSTDNLERLGSSLSELDAIVNAEQKAAAVAAAAAAAAAADSSSSDTSFDNTSNS